MAGKKDKDINTQIASDAYEAAIAAYRAGDTEAAKKVAEDYAEFFNNTDNASIKDWTKLFDNKNTSDTIWKFITGHAPGEKVSTPVKGTGAAKRASTSGIVKDSVATTEPSATKAGYVDGDWHTNLNNGVGTEDDVKQAALAYLDGSFTNPGDKTLRVINEYIDSHPEIKGEEPSVKEVSTGKKQKTGLKDYNSADPNSDMAELVDQKTTEGKQRFQKNSDDIKARTGADASTGETNGYRTLFSEGKRVLDAQKNLNAVKNANPKVQAEKENQSIWKKLESIFGNAVDKANQVKSDNEAQIAGIKADQAKANTDYNAQMKSAINGVKTGYEGKLNNLDSRIADLQNQTDDTSYKEAINKGNEAYQTALKNNPADSDIVQAAFAETQKPVDDLNEFYMSEGYKNASAELEQLTKERETVADELSRVMQFFSNQDNWNEEALNNNGFTNMADIVKAKNSNDLSFQQKLADAGISLNETADKMTELAATQLGTMAEAIQNSNDPALQEAYNSVMSLCSNFNALTGKDGQLTQDENAKLVQGYKDAVQRVRGLYNTEDDINAARDVRNQALNRFIFYSLDTVKTALYMYVSLELKSPQLAYSALNEYNKTLSQGEATYRTNVLDAGSKVNTNQITGRSDADYSREQNEAELEKLEATLKTQGLGEAINVESLKNKYDEFVKTTSGRPNEFALWLFTNDPSFDESWPGIIKALISAGTITAQSVQNALDDGTISSGTFAQIMNWLGGHGTTAGATGYATGGLVGQNQGATMGPDNTTINARNGEMVLNANQQAGLFNFINGLGKGIAGKAINNAVKTGYANGGIVNTGVSQNDPMVTTDKQATLNAALQARQPNPQQNQQKQQQPQKQKGWGGTQH